MDYRMDPVLKKACKQVVTIYCKEALTQLNDDTGAVEECLKTQLEAGNLKSFDRCQTVSRLHFICILLSINSSLSPVYSNVISDELKIYHQY